MIRTSFSWAVRGVLATVGPSVAYVVLLLLEHGGLGPPLARSVLHSRFVVAMQDVSNLDPRPLIIVVERDVRTRDEMTRALNAGGYAVEEFERVESLLESRPQHRAPALIIADIDLAAEGSIALLRALRRTESSAPLVLVTGSVSEQPLNDAFRFGASVVIGKPFAVDDLQHLVECFLTPRRALSG